MGAINYDCVGPITRYEGNMNNFKYLEILENNLLKNFPFLRRTKSRPSKYLFEKDNAGPHRPRVRQWFDNNHISYYPA